MKASTDLRRYRSQALEAIKEAMKPSKYWPAPRASRIEAEAWLQLLEDTRESPQLEKDIPEGSKTFPLAAWGCIKSGPSVDERYVTKRLPFGGRLFLAWGRYDGESLSFRSRAA